MAYWRALQGAETRERRAGFARCLAGAQRAPADAGFRLLVARALSEAWARPAELARAAMALARAGPALRDRFARALRAWPDRIDAHALLGSPGLAALGHDALLLALLVNTQACERDFERFLTLARHALLQLALEEAAPGEEGLAFACALARQCFLNDYVFSCTQEESALARSLVERVAAAEASGRPPAAAALAAIATYVALGSLPFAPALLRREWPEPVCALIRQQVVEPIRERELREAMPALTPVDDEVSRRVQRQYEENPYPRWVHLPAPQPEPLEAYLRRLFPQANVPQPRSGGLDILVAGCGTGQESIDIALHSREARILAIDLSRASLAYAQRKTEEMGLRNLEYAQADIMALPAAGPSFDAIACVGVLHHLAAPVAGWRRLVARLRPGGLMQVGLYSEIGRRDLAAARALIAARGYAADAAGIRRCREELLDSPEFARLASLRDLYGLNECRDLLFHVQEHRFTLPQVKAALAALDLELLGFEVAPAVMAEFRRRFPAASTTDLDAWQALEAALPDTFAGMYLFWVRRAAS